MEIITLILIVTLLFVPVLYYWPIYKERKRLELALKDLPGPRTYPFIGNAYLFIGVPKKDMYKVRRLMTETYKPIFKTWFGHVPVVHLTDCEHIGKIMNSTVNITKGFSYIIMRMWLGEGLLTATGKKWHQHRKMITPAFHFKILESFFAVFVEKGDQLAKQLATNCNGEVFNIFPYVTYCALDVICETAMGVSVNAMSDNDNEYVKAIYGYSSIIMEKSLKPYLNIDAIANMTTLGKLSKYYVSVLHSFTEKVIKERKSLYHEEKEKRAVLSEEEKLLGKKERKSFLDILIDASEDGKLLNDTEIREEVDTFMFEGHDTTTAGMAWCLFLLGNNLDVQEQVHQELDDIFQGENDRTITMKDVADMKILERAIKETLRLYPSVPMIQRYTTESFEVGGHTIPEKCCVAVNIFQNHRNPKYFPNPEKFDPDRFLPENCANRHPYAYIPFSAGLRNCIGQRFALLEEKVILASILRKYKIISQTKQEDVVLTADLILRPFDGIKVIMEKRL